VFVSLATQIPQAAALAVAAALTNATALLAQTFVAVSDLGVQLFLVVGLFTSQRAPDETHPLGYGRERFFWTLFAALGIFVSGFAVATVEAVEAVVNPTPVSSFAVGYVVLVVSLALDGIALVAALRETRRQAGGRGRALRRHLEHTTEPATVTELLSNAIGVSGGIVALVGLALVQATGSVWPDAVASALIGLALMVAAIVLTQKNRTLLTGRGVHPEIVARMREAVVQEPGILEVPDLFAVVVGPSELVVDGDVTFRDDFDVPQVEAAIERVSADLRARWPEIRYVSLTPVPERRPRRATP